MKLETITKEYRGFTFNIHVHHDEGMGEPWKEHDGHGIVSDWTTRDKRPGERVLASDRSNRFYDFAGTMKIAKRDGWGLGEKDIAKLATKLGRKPTKGDILNESVEKDFEYLKGWCDNDWHWIGYTSEIIAEDGTKHVGDSCWGFEGTDDGREYMLGEAESSCQYEIDNLIKSQAEESQEAFTAACADIETIS